MTISKAKFKKIYNDLENYPSLQHVADALGKGISIVRDRARALKIEGVQLIERDRNSTEVQEFKKIYNDILSYPTLESVAEKVGLTLAEAKKAVRRAEILGVSLVDRSKSAVEAVFKKDEFENKFSRDSFDRVEKHKKPGLYFVTSFELGAPAHGEFLSAIENFCDKEGATLVLLPLRPHAPFDENHPYDFRIAEKHLENIYTELQLSSKLSIIELDLNSQQILPLTGTHRVSKGDQSVIVAHSKQHLRMIPTGNLSLPKLQCTTGVVTRSNYKNNRIGKIATSDHKLGGLIVDTTKKHFFTYEVQANKKDGTFSWKSKKYSGTTVEKTRLEGLVLGDIHSGFTDPAAWKATEDQIAKLRPKEIFLHDLWDGVTVSPHLVHNIGARANLPDHVKTLDLEISEARKILERINEIKPKDCTVYVVPSNHPEFLMRYLNGGNFVNDATNYKRAIELAYVYHVLHKNPFQYAIDPEGKLATWLTPDNDHKTAGVTTGYHGHKGLGGAKGSVISAELVYEDYMGGHEHSPKILHNSFVVGTMSGLRPEFVQGSPNSWIHCNGGIYPDGQKTLLFILDGEWET